MSSLLERIRIAQQETKDFPYKIGDEEFSITVQKFKPGTAMRLRKTAMIKLYKVVKAEAVPLSEMTDETFAEQMEAQAARFRETNEHFCDAVVDKETGEKYVSIEDAEELFDNDLSRRASAMRWEVPLLRMKTISRRRRNFLIFLQNPENSDFREEARIFYEESIGRERPYTYYFPDCACAHTP